MFRTSLLVSALALLMGAMSFLSQVVIARTFGAGASLDLYLQATAVPTLAMGAFGAVFTFEMIPALVHERSLDPSYRATTGAFFLLFVAIGAATSAGGILIAPQLLRLLAVPGHLSGNGDEGTAIARLVWCAAGLSIVLGYLAALANSARRFLLPVVAGGLPVVGSISSCLWFGDRVGPRVLAWGMLGGLLAAVSCLMVVVRDELDFSSLSVHGRSSIRRFFLYAPVVILSTLSFSVYQTIDAYWAPRVGTATLSYLSYCQRILIAIGTVMATGPSVVLQPRIAEAAAQGRNSDFLADVGKALRLSITVASPVAVVVSLLAYPAIQLGFQRGAFDAHATLGMAALLPWMMSGMVPMISTVLLFKALYAKSDMRGAVALGLLGPAVYFVLSGILSRVFGAQGIAAAYVATWMLLLGLAMSRIWPRTEWRRGLRSAAGFGMRLALALTMTSACVAPLLQWWVWPFQGDSSVRLGLGVLSISFLGAVVFLFVSVLLVPIAEMRTLAAGLLGSRNPAT